MPLHGLIKKNIAFLSKHANLLSSRIRIRADSHCFVGGTLAADIELDLKEPIEARSLEARLVCVEAKRTKTSREMDTHDYRLEKELGVQRTSHLQTTTSVSEKVVHSERKRLGGRKKYESGTYHAEFQIPHAAPHTRHSYGQDNRKASWRLEAKLDVPLALDISASRAIIVG